MIIYNVTTKIDPSIQSEWLTWLKEEHIPAMMDTRCFTNAVILQLLDLDNTDGPTYAVQYHAESKALYNLYIENFSRTMQQHSLHKWGELIIDFSTVMQVVN